MLSQFAKNAPVHLRRDKGIGNGLDSTAAGLAQPPYRPLWGCTFPVSPYRT